MNLIVKTQISNLINYQAFEAPKRKIEEPSIQDQAFVNLWTWVKPKLPRQVNSKQKLKNPNQGSNWMNAQVNFLARRIGGVNRDCASSPKVDSNFKFGTNFPFKKNLCTGAMSEKSKILIIGGTHCSCQR